MRPFAVIVDKTPESSGYFVKLTRHLQSNSIFSVFLSGRVKTFPDGTNNQQPQMLILLDLQTSAPNLLLIGVGSIILDQIIFGRFTIISYSSIICFVESLLLSQYFWQTMIYFGLKKANYKGKFIFLTPTALLKKLMEHIWDK
jgi:hypothetical protein